MPIYTPQYSFISLTESFIVFPDMKWTSIQIGAQEIFLLNDDAHPLIPQRRQNTEICKPRDTTHDGVASVDKFQEGFTLPLKQHGNITIGGCGRV